MSVHLVGGGGSPATDRAVYGPFVSEAARRVRTAGDTPRIVVIVVGEGAAAQGARLCLALTAAGPVSTAVVAVADGAVVDPGILDGVDGIVIGGGLTPDYLTAMRPAATRVRAAVERGLPYLGFSAGAAIAAQAALVGGWRIGGVPVCPEDAAEDLDEVTIEEGLGLIDVSVEVHAAQWGTLSRLIAATEAGLTPGGVAVDESTALVVSGGPLAVVGVGSVWTVAAVDGGVRVATLAPPDADVDPDNDPDPR